MAKAPPLCYDKHIRKGGAFMFQKEFGLIRACYIKTDKLVQPKRPQRHLYDEERLVELVTSIKHYGIVEPLIVAREGREFVVVSGERRLLAARRLYLKRVPCVVIKNDEDDLEVRGLVANLHRENMTCFELAEAYYAALNGCEMKSERFCRLTGLSSSEVEKKLQILCLDERERVICEAAGVSEKRARYILTMPRNEREHIFADLLSDELCLGQKARILCERLNLDAGDIQKRTVAIKDVRIFFNTINRALEVMKQAGVRAQTERRDGDEYVEYLIKIPANNVLTGV